jgi:putative transposase
MKLDNARANLAGETLKALGEFVGCCVDAGPRHSPDERPYIERFFGTIASRLSSRLPGYTGTSPCDLRRTLADPKGNMRLFVSLDELDELLEYAIASYNGTPHRGLNNATPLEAMAYFVRSKQTLVTWLPEQRRRTLCLMQAARRCRVRAYIEQGVRPHINLYGVRYTNAVLASGGHLIGEYLLIYMNTDDLRCVRAFLSDGPELGVLEAQGVWRVFPHNLKLRQEILKGRCKRRHNDGALADPVEMYVREKLARAGKSRKAATQLAQAVRSRAPAPTAARATDLSRVFAPDVTSASTVRQVPEQLPAAMGDPVPRAPVQPRKLSIGSGQVF